MGKNIDTIDQIELQAKLRPRIEKPYGSKSKPVWINLITIKAWPSDGSGAMRDAPTIFQEEIREPAGKTASMPQLLKPIPKMIAEMSEAMENTAKELACGIVRFHFEFFVPGSDKSVFSHFESLYGDADTSHDLDASFPGGQLGGSERGERAADLRHREQMFRLNRDSMHKTMEMLVEQLENANKRIKDQDAQIVRMHATVEQAHSEAVMRDLAVKSAAKKEELLMGAFSAFMGHLPIIAQYFAGGGNATINIGENHNLSALKAVYNGLPLEVKQDLEMKVLDLMNKIQPAQQNIMMQVFADLKKTETAESMKRIGQTGTSLPSLMEARG